MIPLKTDCRHFRGDVPCTPHKTDGVHCVDPSGADCKFYDPTDRRILLIKLGAIGDVIRTTPLLRKLKEVHPRARITWLTHTPEVIPSIVDDVLPWTLQSLVTLRSIRFDLVINLDKDREACALATQLTADRKQGFVLKDGLPAPADEAAQHKFLTGVFDDVSKANTKNYLQEMFEICGFRFGGERYLLDSFSSQGYSWKLNKKKPVIGLNTGCGGRWVSRLWDEKNWAALAKGLKKRGYTVVLLGGEQEHLKNKRLAARTGASYLGHFPLPQFVNLMDQCSLVVTGVTMALHISIGLGKPTVLINNIFNRHEFELYGNGVLLEPDRPCQCFYQASCTNVQYRCMEHLPVARVLDACLSLLKKSRQ